MNKTKIPWADYTLNPVKGLCPMACPYCYARRMYKRFKWNPEIRYDPSVFLYKPIKPSRIFVGSTIELFHPLIHDAWREEIISICRRTPEHTFIFLTKQPQNLIKFSPFPENCWVGVSVTANGDMTNAYLGLSQVKAPVRFVSFEPLRGMIGMNDHVNIEAWVDWVIIGSQTQPTRHPQRAWVDEIITAADKANIPVFIKEPLASHYGIFREEFPLTIRE